MVLLALLLFACPALAESGVYEGAVVATQAVNVLAPCDGTIEADALRVGERIATGDPVATYATQKVYATGDGTVAAVWAYEGAEIDGTLVTVEPICKYTIYCTVDGGYESPETYFVHAGESLYLKCTSDGTHRGTGIVTSVDGETYMVAGTGGTFYIGETVYLYRDSDFSSTQLVGIGTLVAADDTYYAATGTVIRLYVQPGDRVERGQILYETLGCAETEVIAPVAGIVASVGSAAQDTETSAADGAVSAGDVLAVINPADSLMVEISVPEASLSDLIVGGSVSVVFADDPNTRYPGNILSISNIEEDGAYAAQIAVTRTDLRIGMTCDVVAD